MRISDHRYNRDRLRFDLAVRMLHHGARARTIRTWTGLSKDRQRKLFQVYLLQLPQPPERRMRSKLPHHASCFLRSSTLGFEATTLASLFSILGLICTEKAAEPSATWLNPLLRGEAFCQAYEIYRVLYPTARLSFEHSLFLLESLARKDGVKLNTCGQCQRLYLSDAVRIEQSGCGCGEQRLPLPRRRRTLIRPPLHEERSL